MALFDNPDKVYMHDPRIGMTVTGRLLVRVLIPVIYAVSTVAALLLVTASPESYAKLVGIMVLGIVLDKVIHGNSADRSISDISVHERKINAAHYISPRAFAIIEKGLDGAIIKKTNPILETVKVVFADKKNTEILVRLDIEPVEFIQKLEDFIERDREESAHISTQDRREISNKIAMQALIIAEQLGHENVDVADILYSLFAYEIDSIKKIKTLFSIEIHDVQNAYILSTPAPSYLSQIYRILPNSGRSQLAEHRVINRTWTSRPTIALDTISRDITDAARSGYVGAMIGHEKEYSRLLDTISRSEKPNALIVGEVGIGKHTMIGHLAYNMVRDNVPRPLRDKRIVEVEVARLASMADKANLLRVIAQEIEIAGNVIVCIPDAQNLVKTEGGFLSVVDMLYPIIQAGEFPVIALCTVADYKTYLERRSDISDLFEMIPVEEVATEDALRIVMHDAAHRETVTGISISATAVKEAVKTAKRYLHAKPLPGSAMDVIHEAFTHAETIGKKEIHVSDIISIAEKKSRIPIQRASRDESQMLLHMEEFIHARFVDQQEAVAAVSQALRLYRSGLAGNSGPIASFLFVGPTGVGKTELAKIVSEIQFGNMNAMIRIDMSEYKTANDSARLLGTNGATPGLLTEAVRDRPYSLILLDEFEKANEQVLDLFLQILGDGRLTDGLGRIVDFKNTIIIATSNAHSDVITTALRKGESMVSIEGYVKEKLTDIFKTELLNRFSRIVIFKDLSPRDLRLIARLSMEGVKVLMQEQGIALEVDDDAIDLIAQKGYDPVFGARPLQRVIDQEIKALLAEKILAKEIAAADSVLVTTVHGMFECVVKKG
ncbi:MAG: hypothetical protein RIQ54_179 [Candidatus Parcubacteria bacterium]